MHFISGDQSQKLGRHDQRWHQTTTYPGRTQQSASCWSRMAALSASPRRPRCSPQTGPAPPSCYRRTPSQSAEDRHYITLHVTLHVTLHYITFSCNLTLQQNYLTLKHFNVSFTHVTLVLLQGSLNVCLVLHLNEGLP